MMATEANNADRSVEATSTSATEPAIKITNDLHDDDSAPSSVNGATAFLSADEIDNKQLSDVVDELVNSAEPSISGGSDNELSRIKGKDGEKGHVRTSSSVKKPASFKPVSVNRSFLAAKGTTPAVPVKLGDKTTAAAGVAPLPSAGAAPVRPRLVAKTASGPFSKTGSGANGGRPAAAPDPSVVWNKNRPIPPPEPKKFTDEELKKYGIHMASRLQQDDAKGGQSNWADIDDDDEDWAPEEIQWTDGTKSTIPHQDDTTPPPPAVQPVVSILPLPAAHPLASPSAPLAAALPAPMPPIGRPQFAREVNPIEKPQSPAPMASPSVKPGVLAAGKGLVLKGAPEKPTLVAKPPAPPTPVKSPWATLPPVDKASPVVMDIPSSQMAVRMQPNPYAPPKSGTPPPFKEIAADDFSRSKFGDAHQNRELFNSQSGRLEPVADRRASVKSDPYARHQSAAVLTRPPQADHPEPSAAFQTHRTSGQEAGPYGRRRNSSNVSGGSGGLLQRLGRGHDPALPAPEVLNVRRGSLAGGSDSPSSPRNFSPSGVRMWAPRVSPGANFATPYTTGQPEPRQPGPVAQPPVAGGENVLEMQKRLMTEKVAAAKKRRVEEEAQEAAAKDERLRLKLEAMGPPPERKSAKKDGPGSKDSLSPSTQPELQAAGHSQKKILSNARPAEQAVAGPRNTAFEAKSESVANQNTGRSQLQQTPPENFLAAPDNKQSQPWQPGSGQPERLASWSAGNQATLRNVWGAPNSNNKLSLGNGTFASDLGRVSEAFTSQSSQMQVKPGPGPIGPPAGHKTAPGSQAPIGPPKGKQNVPGPSAPQASRSSWVNLAREQDDSAMAQHREKRAEQQRELEARGISAQDLGANIKDSWKPTKLTQDGRRMEEKEKLTVVHAPATWKAPVEDARQPTMAQKPQQTTAAAGGGSRAPNSASAASQQPRPSRFFPATRDVRLEEPVAPETGRPDSSPSPPPPDMDGHPAFDGDMAHPHVSLPPQRIVVRLPPKSPGAEADVTPQSATRWEPTQPFMGTLAGPQRPFPRELQYPPPASNPRPTSWQDKFDTLLDRPKSNATAKPPTLDSTGRSLSSTRPSFLSPAATRKQDSGVDGSVVSRVMAEECFEEQEMGSLPPIHLPNKAPDAVWHPAQPPKPTSKRFNVVTTTVEPEPFMRDGFGNQHAVRIRFPDMPESNTVYLPQPRSRSNPRRSNYGRGPSHRHASGVQRGPNKPRDSPGPYSSEHASPAGPSHQSPGGRGRGSYRGGRSDSNNWSRHPPPQLQAS